MAKYSEDEIARIKDFIEEQSQIWASEYIAGRVAFLKKKKIFASGDLINQIQSDVNAQARREAVEVLMSFPDHGRHLDMRTMQPAEGGGDYILSILDWMNKRGFSQKFTEKYMDRRKMNKVPERVLVYIAWGIVVKRSKKYKRKAWYNKSKTAAINDIFNIVAAGIPDVVSAQIKEQFNDTKNG